LALVIGLDGIGHTGDQINADWTVKTNTATINGKTVTNQVAGSNQTPKTSPRQVTLTLTGSATPITVTGNVDFQTSGTNVGKYTGTIPYGTTVKAGTYTVRVAIDGHLTKLVPGSVTVVDTNTTVTVPDIINLVAGDITGDNALSSALTISDYNILLSCISDSDFKDLDAHAVCNQNANYKARADLEDNNAWDKFDYNLFLREFSKIQAGD
jgi:methionine-rich copper-binding protein CopC